MAEQAKYRISFEIVNPISHPQAYRGDRPCIPAEVIPDDWWSKVKRESYELADIEMQFSGLVEQIAEGELIRNPLIQRATLTWTTLPAGHREE
jgi:hypothetical protein